MATLAGNLSVTERSSDMPSGQPRLAGSGTLLTSQKRWKRLMDRPRPTIRMFP